MHNSHLGSGKQQIKLTVEDSYALMRFWGNIKSIYFKPQDAVKMALRTEKKILIIELSKCFSMYGDGFKWLEQLSAYADCHEVRVRIVAPKGGKIYRALKLLRYDRIMKVAETLEDAILFNPNLIREPMPVGSKS
jgi:anti-anti-sigma regulatory factor